MKVAHDNKAWIGHRPCLLGRMHPTTAVCSVKKKQRYHQSKSNAPPWLWNSPWS